MARSKRGWERMLLTAFLALGGALGARPAGAQVYVVTELETPAAKYSIANAINNAGQVVGYTATAGQADSRAVLWQNGAIQDLGTLGGPTGIAYAINGLGHVVGWADGTIGSSHAFLYRDGTMIDLGLLAGSSSSAAALNDSDAVVGGANVAGDRFGHGFLFTGGVMHDLGAPDGWLSNAFGINAVGQIVGVEDSVNDEFSADMRAFVSDGVTRTPLTVPAGVSTSACAINDAGVIIGDMKAPGSLNWRGFLYDSSGLHDLGTLGGTGTSPMAINAAGDVVGDSRVPGDTDNHAFLFRGGVMQDLNSLLPAGSGWLLMGARGINDAGQIAAIGRILPAGPLRALLLTPAGDSRAVPPQPPTGVTVRLISTTQLQVSWADASNNESGFEIQRRQNWNNWVPVATVPADTSSTTNAGLGEFIHYIYRVRAVNAAGVSVWSAEASGDTGVGARASLGREGYDFGSVPLGGTAEWSLTITNAGTGPLNLQNLAVDGPEASEFLVTPSTTTIAPAETGSVKIVFTPSALGPRSATLTVNSNAVNGPNTVWLAGTGAPTPVPILSVSPGNLDFGAQVVGASPAALAITLQNSGAWPLTIQSLRIEGGSAGEFSLAGDGLGDATLQPGAIRTLNVRFSPSAVGSRSASLVIADDAQGSPHRVPLAGDGIAPAVGLSVDTVAFGDQLVGTTSDAQSVTVTNGGTAPLTVYGVSVTGANAGDFLASADLAGLTLTVGESRTVSLRFRPTAAGDRDAALTLSDSAPGSPHRVTLTGAGAAPSVSFGISQLGSPTSVNFGEQSLGSTSGPQMVTITNTGSAPLTITGIAVIGANAGDFTLADGGAGMLAPGDSRTLTLRFTPHAAGRRTASLTLTDNAPGGSHSIALSAAGVLPTGGPGAVVPSGAEMAVVAVDGVTANTRHAVISVGQSVTFRLLLKYRNGASADVSTDGNTRILANARRGTFSAKNVWSPRPEDAGKSLVFYGRYYSPTTRKPIVDQVVVSVKAVRRNRH